MKVLQFLLPGVMLFVAGCNDSGKGLASGLQEEQSVGSSVAVKEYHSWASTPPMGWNSWDCFGCSVTEDEVKANADYMAKNLKEFGWEYVVVDIQWYEPKSNKDSSDPFGYPRQLDTNIDEFGRVIPASIKHPSSVDGKGFKPLADYVHSQGLKFGIHMMRGVPKKACEKNTPILGTSYTANDIANKSSTCPWNPDMYGVDTTKPGAQEYYNSLFKLVASWGVDYVKIDDLSRPYYQGEVEAIRKAIDQCGRKIVFSTSPGATPLDAAASVSVNANLWRISDDFWDTWSALKEQFERLDNWSRWCGDGHYPDADMLPLGKVRARANGWTKFTKDEQKTMMSLWSIARSPLMMGGDMPANDEYTLSLMTNAEVLYVNQHSTGGKQVWRNGDQIAWMAQDRASKDVFVCLVNGQEVPLFETADALWSSVVVNRSSQEKTVPVAVEINGSEKLYLVVSDAGDDTNWDHADWLNMELVDKDGKITPLSDLKYVKATTGWGTITDNRSISGGELRVNGQTYANGIGTHSNSIIEYTLPKGQFVKVIGTAALDDGIRGGNGAGASVQFFVFTSEPKALEVKAAEITVDLADMGLAGKYKVRDLWEKKDLGIVEGSVKADVVVHGSVLLRLTPQQ